MSLLYLTSTAPDCFDDAWAFDGLPDAGFLAAVVFFVVAVLYGLSLVLDSSLDVAYGATAAANSLSIFCWFTSVTF